MLKKKVGNTQSYKYKEARILAVLAFCLSHWVRGTVTKGLSDFSGFCDKMSQQGQLIEEKVYLYLWFQKDKSL